MIDLSMIQILYLHFLLSNMCNRITLTSSHTAQQPTMPTQAVANPPIPAPPRRCGLQQWFVGMGINATDSAKYVTRMKELDVDVFKLEVADGQDARNKFSKDWTARIMGIAVVGGFMGYIFLVTLQPPEQNSEALINLVLGYLGGLASAVISFYFGASNTNKD